MSDQELSIACVSNDGRGPSTFTEKSILLTGDDMRRLSEQQAAVNFRLRSSSASYKSGFHVAGDPTLLIILKGELLVRLASGESQSFVAGDIFIAEDYLATGVEFKEGWHGHMAEVISDEPLSALHLKLSKREN